MTAANDNGPLGRIYSVAEAAKALGIGRPKLEALIREFPYYTPNGNRKLFNDDDIKKLWEVRRCPLPSPNVLVPTGGTLAVPTAMDDQYSDLLRPKTDRLQKRSSSRRTRGS